MQGSKHRSVSLPPSATSNHPVLNDWGVDSIPIGPAFEPNRHARTANLAGRELSPRRFVGAPKCRCPRVPPSPIGRSNLLPWCPNLAEGRPSGGSIRQLPGQSGLQQPEEHSATTCNLVRRQTGMWGGLRLSRFLSWPHRQGRRSPQTKVRCQAMLRWNDR